MFPHLQSQRVNLQLLQKSSCDQLVKALKEVDEEGGKVVVLDEAILGPIGLVATLKFFDSEKVTLQKLSKDMNYPKDIANVIYIVRPEVPLMDIIATHVLREKNRNFYLYFVPRLSCLCKKHLESRNVLGSFTTIDELSWNFFPLEKDVVSMEWLSAFHDVQVEGDVTVHYQAALGLVQLQRLYGRIPKIYGKGTSSQRIWEHAKQLGIEEKSLYTGDKGSIDSMIMLDRSIDVMSALATQLTYEGLIDELYGVKENRVMLPAEKFTRSESNERSVSQQMAQAMKTIDLNSSKELFADLRDKNFNEVGKILAENANKINGEINRDMKGVDVDVMKRYMDKLPAVLAQKDLISTHTTIAEMIRKEVDEYEFTDNLAAEQEFMVCEDIDKPSAYIEDLIAKKSDLRNVLRLICIQCAAGSGFKEKVLNYYKRELVHVYGIETLLKLASLEKAGLLTTQSESRTYAILRKTINLTVDDVIEINPKDISYVHSFYAPLTARIVEQSLKPLGWQSLKSQIHNLPGPTFEDFQAPLIGIGGRQSSAPSECSALNIPRLILVFFAGGCTFAEIAALRFLSLQEDNHVQFIIATTKIINKNTFLDSIIGKD